MPERIKVIAAFKLLQEYFKEQPKKILLYASTFMIPYCFIQIQNMLFQPYNEAKNIWLTRMITALIAALLFYLIVPRKKTKRNPLIIGILSSAIILEGLQYSHFQFIPNHDSPQLLGFILGLFTKAIPFGIILYLFARMNFIIIEKKELTMQKILKYSHSLLPLLGFIVSIEILSIPLKQAYYTIAMLPASSTLKIPQIVYSLIIGGVFWIITNYFFIRIFCAPFLMIDRSKNFLTSVKVSWKITKGHALRLFIPIAIYSFLRFCIGVIPAIPLPFFRSNSGLIVMSLWSGFHFIALPIGFAFAALCYRLLSNSYYDEYANTNPQKFNGDFS